MHNTFYIFLKIIILYTHCLSSTWQETKISLKDLSLKLWEKLKSSTALKIRVLIGKQKMCWAFHNQSRRFYIFFHDSAYTHAVAPAAMWFVFIFRFRSELESSSSREFIRVTWTRFSGPTSVNRINKRSAVMRSVCVRNLVCLCVLVVMWSPRARAQLVYYC